VASLHEFLHIAVNPYTPYTTFDGGATWINVQLPHLTFQTGATGLLSDMDSAGDPVVSFGPNNTVYYGNIAFSRLNDGNAITVNVSHDGGLTWGEPAIGNGTQQAAPLVSMSGAALPATPLPSPSGTPASVSPSHSRRTFLTPSLRSTRPSPAPSKALASALPPLTGLPPSSAATLPFKASPAKAPASPSRRLSRCPSRRP
jgi:hypothetical protein